MGGTFPVPRFPLPGTEFALDMVLFLVRMLVHAVGLCLSIVKQFKQISPYSKITGRNGHVKFV